MTADEAKIVDAVKIVGGGRALAHVEGETWMVEGALPGETVRAKILRRRRRVVEARALEVVQSRHALRHPDPCPDARHCGGCDWPHVIPLGGAALKAEVAAEAARSFAELREELRSANVVTSPEAYRLRSRLHWRPDTKALGFYGRGTHTVFPLTRCRIVSPLLAQALGPMADALARSCPVPVDVEWLEDLTGDQSVAALRSTAGGAEVRRTMLPDENALAATIGGFHCLDRKGQVRIGWGSTHVTMRLPRPLDVPIGGFFQVNRHLVPWLFRRTAELVGETPLPTWDLFAGVGFLAAAALHAGRRTMVAVEAHRQAAEAARRNLPGAEVHVGMRAETYLGSAGRLPRQALVLLDPPRAGCSARLRRQLLAWRPRVILGLACDPATWARDSNELCEAGYRLTHLELVDLFPSTHHVEILYRLELT